MGPGAVRRAQLKKKTQKTNRSGGFSPAAAPGPPVGAPLGARGPAFWFGQVADEVVFTERGEVGGGGLFAILFSGSV